MIKKVIFIGYIGEGFGDFLNKLHKYLSERKIDLEAIQLGLHNDAFVRTNKPYFSLFKYDNVWHYNNIKFNMEQIIAASNADFYLLWNGYHDFYASIRSILKNYNLPHLLCEYSSIKQAYLFDLGFHGDSSTKFIKRLPSKDFNFEPFKDFLLQGYATDNKIEHLLDRKLNDFSKFKKLLFLGIWEDASGFNKYNKKEIQHNLSLTYQNNKDAFMDILSVLPHDWILIFKPHPAVQRDANTQAIKENIVNIDNAIYIENDISLLDLIRESDAVSTITSTTSILTACIGKPLLMLGNSYINCSLYSYNLTDFNTIKDAVFALTNKIHWDQKKNHRLLFFESYIYADFLYSHNPMLNKQGVQEVNILVDRIVKELKCEKRNDYPSSFKSISLIESCLSELSNTQNQLQKKINTLFTIQEIIQEIKWYSIFQKNWKIKLKNLKKELNNQLN